MTIKMTHYDDKCYSIEGSVTATESSSFGGTTTLGSLTLVQTLGGTATGAAAKWATDNTPCALTTGQLYFTLTLGASTFRVPMWATT